MTLGRNSKVAAVFLFCLVMVLCSLNATYACTAIYVCREVSTDSTALIAKSNDYSGVWANYVEITERVEDEPGRVMPVDNDATVMAELPATTYRYTSTPWMDTLNVEK